MPPGAMSPHNLASAISRYIGSISITCISLSHTWWLCTPLHGDTCDPSMPGLSVLPAGHAHPVCYPHACFLLPERTPTETLACSVNNLNTCVKCLEMEDSQTEALRTYSLILAGVGGFLPLLLTLIAYSVLGLVVLHSQGMTTAQKLHVAVLVASGVALYACSFAVHQITQVLHVDAKLHWMARCPSFSNRVQAEQELVLGPFFSYPTTCILVPPGHMNAPLALHGCGTQPELPPMSPKL